eukprot:705250-Amphidinium_carterae.1
MGLLSLLHVFLHLDARPSMTHWSQEALEGEEELGDEATSLEIPKTLQNKAFGSLEIPQTLQNKAVGRLEVPKTLQNKTFGSLNKKYAQIVAQGPLLI